MSIGDKKIPKVLVTGATGQLGRALMATDAGALDLIAPGRHELDLTDSALIHRVVDTIRPDLIVNAAGVTGPEHAEADQDAALAVNARAVETLARAAKEVSAAFLHISTDHVFDGSQSRPYTETDHAAPLNMYGATKLLGEELAQLACPRTAILRTSTLHAPWGRNPVCAALSRAEEGAKVSAASDRVSSATSVEILAETCLRIAPDLIDADPYSDCWGVTHCAALDSCSEAELLTQATKLAGLNPSHVEPTEMMDWPTGAAHPKYTALDCTRLVRVFGIQPQPWREHLARTLHALRPVETPEAA